MRGRTPDNSAKRPDTNFPKSGHFVRCIGPPTEAQMSGFYQASAAPRPKCPDCLSGLFSTPKCPDSLYRASKSASLCAKNASKRLYSSLQGSLRAFDCSESSMTAKMTPLTVLRG